MAAFARKISQLPGGSLMTLDYFHHGRDSILFLLEETLMLNMDLSSLPNNASAKTTICGRMESLIHCYGIPHSIFISFRLFVVLRLNTGPPLC